MNNRKEVLALLLMMLITGMSIIACFTLKEYALGWVFSLVAVCIFITAILLTAKREYHIMWYYNDEEQIVSYKQENEDYRLFGSYTFAEMYKLCMKDSKHKFAGYYIIHL